jgi:acetoin utilization protein AcuB
MNISTPISNIMTKHLITVTPQDSLMEVKAIFDAHHIHHIPVVRYKTIVGLISKTDFLHFLRGNAPTEGPYTNESRLRTYTASDIMADKLTKVASNDRLDAALHIFCENKFHALPVVDEGELVGIITTHDIIRALLDEDTQPLKKTAR